MPAQFRRAEKLNRALVCLCAVVFPSSATASDEPIPLAMIEAFSGPFGNAGEAVARNLRFAIERVNARGGVRLPGGARMLKLEMLDSKGQMDEALLLLSRAADAGVPFVLQGNSSTVAAAFVDAIKAHNNRFPGRRMLFLNFSAGDPALTNERCSPWHFRFDAHAEMRMAALVEAMAADPSIARVYLLNQDYSFGRQVAASARVLLAERLPQIRIVGEALHPPGRIDDFSPYVAKIKASGADAVVTGSWGNDLTLLVRAAREAGLAPRFFTFYGNGLGAPGAVGDAGVGRVRAVAEWHPNAAPASMEAVYQAFRRRYPDPRDDYFQARAFVMVDMLVRAIERAGGVAALPVARALSGMSYATADGNPLGDVVMRGSDHQLLGSLVVSVMQRKGGTVRFDVEGSGYGFSSELLVPPQRTQRPTRCRMTWPPR